jgi:chaperonin GroEL (HSP60 family)
MSSARTRGHPAAKMMVEIAKTQDDMVGDGTTTAVVLAVPKAKNKHHPIFKK